MNDAEKQRGERALFIVSRPDKWHQATNRLFSTGSRVQTHDGASGIHQWNRAWHADTSLETTTIF